MDRMQAREEALRRAKKKRMGRGIEGPMTAGPRPQRRMTMGQMQRLKERMRRQQMMQARPGMLTGGQAKIAAKAPPTNKITGADFAVLRKEKAKGRGKGLQDEKMKPGKIMKARKGVIIKPKGPGVIRPKPQDRYGQQFKPTPIKPKKKMGGGMMMRPNPVGYKTGKSVKVKCKLGKNKPTKMY